MKSALILTIAVMLLSAVPAYSVVADNEITSQKIKEADNTTSQDTNTGSGVKTGHIQNSAVTSTKIAPNAVTEWKIADGAVKPAKIADNAVTSTKIAPNAVVSGKIADSAVTSTKIAPNAVVSGKIANNAVTNTKIADGAVSNTKIADSAVSTPKIADGAVTGAKIADNAVTGTEIADGSITATDLSAALYSDLTGGRLNIRDGGARLVGPFLGSAQDTASPAWGNQVYALLRTSGGTPFGLRTASPYLVSIAPVHYTSSSCYGTAYSANNYSASVIQPAHIGIETSSRRLYAFIHPAGTLGQTVLYYSSFSFNTVSNTWTCINYSSPYQGILYLLAPVYDLSAFVPPFRAGN